MTGLTRRQAQLLDYIERFTSEAGYAPSTDQMRVALGLASKSGISRILGELEDRGRIRRRPGCSRSAEVIRTDPYSAEAIRNLSGERLERLLETARTEVIRRVLRPTARPEGAGRVA